MTTALSVSGELAPALPVSTSAQRPVPRILQLLSKLRVDQRKRNFTCDDFPGMSSTLVETVSIDYEDFNESFLTCSTCLCTYDSEERTPKLISCSHTVCLQCLSSIVATNRCDPAGTLRCPICRALVQLPAGGVSALPASFVVNQLLDLMARQRREVVPKCSTHQRQDLMFCETCDTVFCAQCVSSEDDSRSQASQGCACSSDGTEHTIVPFSVAIKRISEILLYKVNDCSDKLERARVSVQTEIDRLSANVNSTIDVINSSFQRLLEQLQNRRQTLMEQVGKMHDEKRQVLEAQLGLIDDQCDKLRVFSSSQQQQSTQMDVRSVTSRISDLNETLDAACDLSEPRENCFLRYEERQECDEEDSARNSVQQLKRCLSQFGHVYSSSTFPALCQISSFSCSAHLTTSLTLTAFDRDGVRRERGGDPVAARVIDPSGRSVTVAVRDLGSGEYRLQFRTRATGTHSLDVSIFDRPVSNSPQTFQVSQHNEPVRVVGGERSGDADKHPLLQPTSVAISTDGSAIYVTDTGNSRINVYNRRLQMVKQLVGRGLEERAGVGVAVCPPRGRDQGDLLLVVNWRSGQVSQVDGRDGRLLLQLSNDELRQPVAVWPVTGALVELALCLVADSGLKQAVALSSQGAIVRRFGSELRALAGVCMSGGRDACVVTAGADLLVWSIDGAPLKQLFTESPVAGIYGGVTCDELGNILATRSEKSRHYVQVFSLDSGKLQFWIESEGNRLRRPAGLACSSDGSLYVADLGNHSLKQYRYL